MSGRKPLYDLETLEIGAKMPLLGKAKKYADQYIYNFNSRPDGRGYRKVIEGRKIFVERIA